MIEQTGFPQRVERLVFSSDGRFLAFAGHMGTVNLWNLEDRSLKQWEAVRSGGTDITTVAFLDGDRQLLIASRNRLQQLELETGEPRDLVTKSRIPATLVHAEGDRVFTTSPNVIRCHRISAWKELWSAAMSFGEYTLMAYQPRSDRIFVCGSGHPIEIRHAGDGELVQRIHTRQHPVYRIRFSHDERFCVLCLTTECVVLDGTTFKPITTLKTPQGKYFTDCEFHPMSPLFATTANDGAVRLWDTENWTERIAYTWEIGAMRSVAFAPDGMRIAAGTGDGRVIVWDVDW